MATVNLKGTRLLNYRPNGGRLGRRAIATTHNPFYGSSSAVYPVLCNIGPQTPYALKFYYNYFYEDRQVIEKQLGSEFRILDSLPPHPNVIRAFAGFVDDWTVIQFADLELDDSALPFTQFVLLERADQTLDEFIHRNPNISLRDACDIIQQLLRGVDHLQKHNVAHRNIKPDNVMISAAKQWKLIGFHEAQEFPANPTLGLAKMQTPYTDGMSRGGAPVTLAPEIYHAKVGSTLDYGKADLWAVGQLIYRIANMETPFGEKAFRSDANYDASRLPPLPMRLASLQPVLIGLLAATPANRWTVATALQALDQILTSLTPVTPTVPVAAPATPTQQRGPAGPAFPAGEVLDQERDRQRLDGIAAAAPPTQFAVRVQSVVEEKGDMLSPIFGVRQRPLLTLREAIQDCPVREVTRYAYFAKLAMQAMAAERGALPYGLTIEEAASIRLYTDQWETAEDSLYFRMNSVLRSADRGGVKPFFNYLKLLFTALDKLPKVQATVYRGVCSDLRTTYQRGRQLPWWAFSSCSDRLDVLQNDMFLGEHGHRTMFHITVRGGVRVREFSSFQGEDEVLLMPGIFLQVDSTLQQQDLTLVQLHEIQSEFAFVE
eukprot:TRINITY_DN10585_c0_g1_i1.p1 TRINITY_DN10585_c0_g1~~TRINITY_DN10585_c0_g1_i1.p1  ORF type:complete len:612 (-),score=131.13 TRINITY_DN10585_c0_g1_i1:99-1907(-)